MENSESKFKKGGFYLVTEDQTLPCGRIRLHEGEIVKVVNPDSGYRGRIDVYRNLEREQRDNIDSIDPTGLEERPDLESVYNSGVKNFNYVKEEK